MYYRKVCGSGGHFFHENIYYRRTCPVGGQVLQVCTEVATIDASVNLGGWCFFFSLSI